MAEYSLPTVRSYGEYKSDNYGIHCLQVTLGPITLWFSYKTLVAFRVAGESMVVRQNDWGPTTGKHLKWIDDGDKKSRVSAEEFQHRYQREIVPLLSDDQERIRKPRNH